jgi:hypothetical protein
MTSNNKSTFNFLYIWWPKLKKMMQKLDVFIVVIFKKTHSNKPKIS